MERTATWNGIRFASFLDAKAQASKVIDAANGVFPVISVWNPDGTLYKDYTLGKVPERTTPIAPAPTPDALATLTARVETLEALVASLVSASLEAPTPKGKRGRKATAGVPFDDALPQVG